MARRIYKWPLPAGERHAVPWSPDDKVLMVAEQHGDLTLWAEQEDSQPATRRALRVVGTGFDAPVGWEHLGSAVCGEFVWHLYGAPVERPF